MLTNNQFLTGALAVFVIGLISSTIFYFNSDATADVIFQGNQNKAQGKNSDQGIDVNTLQKKITREKQDTVKFQQHKNPMGYPLKRDTKPDKKTGPKTPQAPYKLQGIWYEPGGSSTAIIDGNMVQVGGFLSDGVSRVTRIDKNEVEIRRASRKFVLALEVK